MGWSWLRRRADRGNAPAPAVIPSPAAPAVQREPDWPHLSPVQRTLAEPLAPVAPLDTFTDALATHHNPSFLGALGHHVDPDGPGGLITGLAVPRAGRPVPYAGTAELTVPPRNKPRPAVQRRVASWSTPTETTEPVVDPFPAAVQPESVEPRQPEPVEVSFDNARTAPSTSSGHVAATPPEPVEQLRPERVESPSTDPGSRATVPLVGEEPLRPELVDGAVDELGAVPSTSSARMATRTEPAVATPLSVPGAAAPTLSANTPLPAIQRRLAAVPDVRPRTAGFPPPPSVTLPVVAREVADQSTAATRTPTILASAPPASGPAAPSTTLPSLAASGAVQRSAVDTTPVLAEAEPITVLPDPEPPADQPAKDTVPLAYDETTAAEISPPLSQHPTIPGSAAVLPTFPVGGSVTRAPQATQGGGQPTVQPNLVGHTPPIVQRRPIGHDEPFVQRTTGHPGPVAPLGPVEHDPAATPLPSAAIGPPPAPPVASPAMPARSAVEAVEPAGPTAPLSGFAAQITALTNEPRPAEPGRTHPSTGSAGNSQPLAAGASPLPPVAGPDAVAAPVQRRAVVGPPAVQRLADPTLMPTPTTSLVADRPPALSVRTDLSSATNPAPPIQQVSFAPMAQSAGQPSAVPVVSRVAEPIRIASPSGHAPAPSAPALPQTPASGPGPTTAAVALPMPTAPPSATTPMVQRSFAAMFTRSDTAIGGSSRPDDDPGSTSVQLQPADEPAPAPTPEPTPTAAPPPEASPAPTPAAAPAAGAAPADLDEMARRLFEPLSARLRAELWLDRERAGLVTDARH